MNISDTDIATALTVAEKTISTFSHAIVKVPCRNLVNGITSSNSGIPDFEKAFKQHKAYCDALIKCGLEVTVLDADNNFPDSTFIEDVALLTPNCAVITNPFAPSRKDETIGLKDVLSAFYFNEQIEKINHPGTVDAGDIMMVGSHFYIGLSARTNREGAEQMTAILNKYGMTASTIAVKNVLHLKTGISYLENNNLLVSSGFISDPELQKFNLMQVSNSESYAANCLWINGTVLVPGGYQAVKNKIEKAGYPTIEIDMSEFQKVDGGLTCLSLRF